MKTHTQQLKPQVGVLQWRKTPTCESSNCATKTTTNWIYVMEKNLNL
jgi:hypothetical protein